MLNIDSPVGSLPFVGPKYKKLLEKLEIFTVKDLLFHVPFRYDDYSDVKTIDQIVPGETITVQGILSPVQNIFTKYGKRITKASVVDRTGKLELIWFNQHYLKKVLLPGQTYTVSGKVGAFDKKMSIFAPQIEELKENSLNTGRLVPVYPETAGVSSKWLRVRINNALSKIDKNDEFEETLPSEILEVNRLKSLNWAIKNIHFPSVKLDAEEARHRLSFEELFYDLLKVEKRKQDWNLNQKSYKFKEFSQEVSKFIKDLPFVLTDSQQESADQIIADLLKPQPMNRLLEGDVGTGKTVVAVVATYLTLLNDYKVVYLAPTEILANQHYETFSKLLAKTNTKVSLLTRTSKNVLENSNIIIGTHAVLFNTEIFNQIGLIIIDEQHRFGVEQRGKLMELSKQQNFTPNLLTMTATPIPRTLALTIYGDLSLSTLKTHPNSERNIVTKLVKEEQRNEIYEWIVAKGLSTFIVCPFIETSETESLSNVKAAEKEFEDLKNGPLAKVSMGLIHGRLKPAEKQKVINDFREGKIKVLVATPVIEVGIDIPDATVILIEGSERYGLASLHQLRGRVGRYTGKGFCFLFMTTFSSKAYERLKNLENVFDGMQLAQIDMKMRGQGDVFTTMQHGYKKFKIADLDDFGLIEKAKVTAEKVFAKIDNYPKIKQKLLTNTSEYIRNN